MSLEIVSSAHAPRAIGPYSQALAAGQHVFTAGQIGLDPAKMELVAGGMEQQIRRVFENLATIAEAAGGKLADIAKLTIYLIDLEDFQLLNRIMAEYFQEPYPARAVVGVARLPRDSRVEMDAVLMLQD